MAVTPADALKAWLDAQALGVVVFRRHAPDRDPNDATKPYPLPYIVIQEGIAAATESHEDGGKAAGGATYVAEELQVDLWMYEQDPTAAGSGLVENYSVPYALAAVLDGAPLTTFGTPAKRMYACVLRDGPREVPDPDPNVIRKVYAVDIHRET